MSDNSRVAVDRFTETPVEEPPMQVTEEAKKEHLELAQAQGVAYGRALAEMAQSVAQLGAEKAAGHFVVGGVASAAVPMAPLVVSLWPQLAPAG